MCHITGLISAFQFLTYYGEAVVSAPANGELLKRGGHWPSKILCQ
jgi:hypothetical protein